MALALVNGILVDESVTRVLLPATGGADWVVNHITVGNVAVPPSTDEDRASMAAAALRHDPLITRTLHGGPGNRSHLRGCLCQAPGVKDAATWAAHVGAPAPGPFIEYCILPMCDLALDVINHPSSELSQHLRDCTTGRPWLSAVPHAPGTEPFVVAMQRLTAAALTAIDHPSAEAAERLRRLAWSSVKAPSKEIP